jgi:type II secretion system protein G
MESNIKNIMGFTLVEMAVVLVIFGLLLSSVLLSVTAQRDVSDYAAVRTDISQIKEALYGYAIVNGTFPCADSDGDGIENTPCNTALLIARRRGNVPWVTLGLSLQKGDPWNRLYQYRVDSAFVAAFTLSTSGTEALRICTSGTCTAPHNATNVPVLIYSLGKNGGITPAVGADQLENTDNDTNFVSQDFAPTFDDVVDWVSPNILFNRMVTAGKLP